MLPTRRPVTVTPRLGAGAALLSGPAVAEIEAATLVIALPVAAVAIAVVEVLAVMGVLAWSVALAVLVGLFCLRAGHWVRRWRQDDDRLGRR